MNSFDEYEQSIQQIGELYRLPIVSAKEVGLQRISRLLHELGNPERCFRSVHVTGSSGKGSTTSMVNSILMASGRRTGCFRSPHLYSYRERIAVDDTFISPGDWIHCFHMVWTVVESMRDGRLSGYALGRPSLFEVLFSMAALYFAEQDVDWVAAEVGMGGRLDATNVLQPDVAVVTNVSLDHTEILGKTPQEIAHEKSAIIKPGMHAVTAQEDGEALDVIVRRAHEVWAPLLRIGVDVDFQVESESLRGQQLHLASGGASLTVNLPLAGYFQATNAATAYAVTVALRGRGVDLRDSDVARGLEAARVPGRFEIVSERPLVLLDGAHNPAKALALRDAVLRLDSIKPAVLIFAAMSDKDIHGMAQALAPITWRVIATVAPSAERSASPQAVAAAFDAAGLEVDVMEDPLHALKTAVSLSGLGGSIVVTGSLYLVGYVRHALQAVLSST